MDNLEQTLDFYCRDEIATFQQSEYYSKLSCLAKKLNYIVKCSFGYGLEDKRRIYLDFSIRNGNDEIVYVDNLDYEHLCDATCIIEFDKKQRYKFYSWEKDNDFIESILWAINELEIKIKCLTE